MLWNVVGVRNNKGFNFARAAAVGGVDNLGYIYIYFFILHVGDLLFCPNSQHKGLYANHAV